MKFLAVLILFFGGLKLCAQDFSIIGKWQSKDFGQTTIFHFKSDSTVDVIVNNDTFNKWTLFEEFALSSSFLINTKVWPNQLDLIFKKTSNGELWSQAECIFKKLKGGQLMICFIQGKNVRPTTFETKTGNQQFCITFQKIE